MSIHSGHPAAVHTGPCHGDLLPCAWAHSQSPDGRISMDTTLFFWSKAESPIRVVTCDRLTGRPSPGDMPCTVRLDTNTMHHQGTLLSFPYLLHPTLFILILAKCLKSVWSQDAWQKIEMQLIQIMNTKNDCIKRFVLFFRCLVRNYSKIFSMSMNLDHLIKPTKWHLH